MAEAIVIGGGIGGVAAALALRRVGWGVTVLERAPGFTEIGAGLALWPNAMRALAALGLAEQVRAIAGAETVGGVRARSGRRLSRADSAAMVRRHGWPLLLVHRAELLRVLLAALPPESLRAGSEVRQVLPGGVVVDHRGERSRGDLVVAADGVRSGVRRQWWPEAPGPRPTGHVAWRAVTAPLERRPEGALFWGRGERIGFAALTGGRFYCFAAARGSADPSADPYEEMIGRFGGWPDPLPELLAAVPVGGVLRHEVYEAPPLSSFVRGRVALLGDAAHAMEPTLGQGAGTAIEDAVTLAALVRDRADVEGALARYDRSRRPRTRAVARRSARLGAAGLVSSAPAAWVRDRVARLVPHALVLRSMDGVLGWRPPSLGVGDA